MISVITLRSEAREGGNNKNIFGAEINNWILDNIPRFKKIVFFLFSRVCVPIFALFCFRLVLC